jgi:histidine triad (HIT) family protein
MHDCLFCNVVADSSRLIWENDIAAAFNDIHPKSPVHILVVPKQHIPMLDNLDDVGIAGQMLLAVRDVAERAGVKGAYKVLLNNGRPAGQIIDHLHFHIMAELPRHKNNLA